MEQPKWVPSWKVTKIAIGEIILVRQRPGGLKQHVQNLPSLARKTVAQVLHKHLYLQSLAGNPKHWMSSPHGFTMGFFLVSRNCFRGLPFSIWEKCVNMIHSRFFFLLDIAHYRNTNHHITMYPTLTVSIQYLWAHHKHEWFYCDFKDPCPEGNVVSVQNIRKRWSKGNYVEHTRHLP